MRLSDYCLYQLLESLTDTDPYQEMIEKLKRAVDPFTEDEGMTNIDRMTMQSNQNNNKLNAMIEDMIDDDISSKFDEDA